MIRSFDGLVPQIAESAYVDERATVVGDVRIEADASVWPGVVLRGDRGRIVVREGANVQDNATVHEGSEIGPSATVGHNAIVHAATVGARSVIGMGAIVLDRGEVGAESIVAANSVVTPDTSIPDSVLAMGAPAGFGRRSTNPPGGKRRIATSNSPADTRKPRRFSTERTSDSRSDRPAS